MIIKVCGMRDGDNIRALEKTDIDWMGFIFYPKSPRYVSDDETWTEAIQACSKTKVGVFVNEKPDEIVQKAAKYRFDYVQLHGNESPDCCRQLKDEGFTVIKALPVSSPKDLQPARAYTNSVDYLLFDTKNNLYGGTGQRFDWSTLEAYKGNIPFLLSGGIGIEHIGDIWNFRHPKFAGIDVNSRFERSPGIKDIHQITSFTTQLSTFHNKTVLF